MTRDDDPFSKLGVGSFPRLTLAEQLGAGLGSSFGTSALATLRERAGLTEPSLADLAGATGTGSAAAAMREGIGHGGLSITGLTGEMGTASAAAAMHERLGLDVLSISGLAGGTGTASAAAAMHERLGLGALSISGLTGGTGTASAAAAMHERLGLDALSISGLTGGTGTASAAAAMHERLGLDVSSISGLTGGTGTASAAAAMHERLGLGALSITGTTGAMGTSPTAALYERASLSGSAITDLMSRTASTSRPRLWAETLAPLSTTQIANALGTSSAIRSEIEKISRRADELLAIPGHAYRFAGETETSSELFARTSQKMSVLAGAMDVLGVGARTSDAAFHSLFGDWHTHRGLPEEYWRDWSTRARMYREAEVDPGLIDSDETEVVEALVESGVVEGVLSSSGSVTAILEIGDTKMRISARRPRAGAHDAISVCEAKLRAFVSARLASENGDDWFKRRVPGEVLTRAKGRRREALRGGEDWMPLIHYVDLGDLIPIVTRADNWCDVFAAVFLNAEHFRVDLERLNASRRPAAHTRKVDPVRLAEIMIVINRLLNLMKANGEIDTGWDADR